MSAGDVKHDYHLVNPSPWPLVGSIAACVMAVGGVIAMKGLFGLPKGDLTVLLAGFAGVLLTMAGWWRDVTVEANQGDHTPVVGIGLRYGMIMFIASEVMFFVAWFWIFFEMALFNDFRTQSGIEEVRAAWSTWPPRGVETIPAWNLPLLNTLILLLSGTTVTWAHHALQAGDRRGAKIGLLLTVILGAIFTAVQVYEYDHILKHNYFFGGEGAENSGLYGSAFFMATGFHGFHVLIGTIFLLVCLARLMGTGFTPKQHFGFESAAWYWHFVDVVWLFLFAFIYVVFGASGGH
ncbi:MAG: cytochrome c oxidase subunit 3 [Phenylobacterium sp.]|jgi:cytochrome c oxidase subunit 3|uniref:cytochrome c oxidase subunit 3 n=1 Tax=Phenylobacterium sp. TaxID=1871053 RepID=UPI0025F2F67E|nr:cytochrome c oxidase subunit 3 [Phenylobacterium sp.]MCA3710123.1 cytochrome c oxidase subunit 3 [Phenylobacterium sp.]MCA3712741.1 cytochrome c oxidase subunit 3 [Phenylobacterium sp.]MCA3723426.1 cytochrome c oxidase subunit 3 [Phenylobacterium sp.]MCA3725585.1 cytochrome c oxidase subunit 3 [Phenylobacterium sp.]MCA3732018.1 cytochrome c oxidase subunit 3 [Phenylobacterium sp.]